MKWLNNIKIGARLNFIIGGFVMLTLIGFGTYISVVMSKEMNQTTHERMSEQIDDLVEILRVEIENNQQQVNISLNLARNYIQTLGAFSINDDETVPFRATNQVTHQSYSVSLPIWMIEGVQIQRDEKIVDHIASMGVSTVTIFQKTDQGYLRISTNVRNENNERAIGTYIPFDSPVVKMVERGETYFGRAWVVNDWYLSAYEPIYYEGNIVGMLYVGTPEKDLASLKTFFHRKNYFINGYPYVVDSEGLLIIHPTMENTSIANEGFFKTMKMDRSGAVGKMDYIWQGIDKVQYYSYVEDIDSYVVVNYTKNDMRAFLRSIYFGSIVAALFSTILVISLVIYIVRSVTNSLAKGVEFAGKLAEGDLTATIDIFQRDELGVLAESFRNMAEKIRDIVEGIQMGAASIAGAGNEISSASQQLSQGANEQASSAEEVSSSMEEMAANIHQNTENAQFAQESISRVANSLESLSVAGNESHVATRTIAEKINIISDIAFQTNILALNAAVEAARAGEHGRGFAVVAAEVRKLAEHSKMAAEEIVGLAESSVVASEKATEIVNEVAPEIIKTVKLAQEIAAASIEQTSGADQINNAIQQLNQVTQQNAAASEQMATSSEELSSQAEQLRDMVSFFRISEDKAVYQKGAKKESVQTRRTRYAKTQSSKPNKGILLKGFEGTSHSEGYEKF